MESLELSLEVILEAGGVNSNVDVAVAAGSEMCLLRSTIPWIELIDLDLHLLLALSNQELTW